jgi:hypothetical protein
MNLNQTINDPPKLIFEEVGYSDEVGRLTQSSGEIVYYNNRKKLKFANYKIVEREIMTEAEVDFVKMDRVRREQEDKELERLQKEYLRQIEEGRTWGQHK